MEALLIPEEAGSEDIPLEPEQTLGIAALEQLAGELFEVEGNQMKLRQFDMAAVATPAAKLAAALSLRLIAIDGALLGCDGMEQVFERADALVPTSAKVTG